MTPPTNDIQWCFWCVLAGLFVMLAIMLALVFLIEPKIDRHHAFKYHKNHPDREQH